MHNSWAFFYGSPGPSNFDTLYMQTTGKIKLGYHIIIQLVTFCSGGIPISILAILL